MGFQENVVRKVFYYFYCLEIYFTFIKGIFKKKKEENKIKKIKTISSNS